MSGDMLSPSMGGLVVTSACPTKWASAAKALALLRSSNLANLPASEATVLYLYYIHSARSVNANLGSDFQFSRAAS